MKTIRLSYGTDSLVLDPIAFGLGLPLGRDPRALHPVLDAYLERGRLFDSARIYGNLRQHGAGGADAFLGRYLKERGRSDAVVATKGGHPSILRMRGDRLSAADLRKDLEESLRFLQRDRIDVYFLHRDSGRDVAEVMPALGTFVREGKVRFLGASNWRVERILEANAFAARHGLPPFVVGQVQDSYATPGRPPFDPTIVVADAAERAKYRASGLPYFAFSAQARGFFSRLAKGAVGPLDPDRTPANLRRFAVVERLAAKHGAPVAAIALRPLLDADEDVVPIVSSSDPEHLRETLRALDVALEPEDLRALRAERDA